MRELKGRVAVVTGAASGIGRETALALAREGCALALCDVNAEPLEETRRLCESEGARATSHVVDVSDRAAMAAFADAVVEAHGAAHIVINNAGVTIMASFEDQTLEDMDWILGINIWGVIHGCKFFLPHLKAAGEGHIVNISSAFGIIAPPLQTSYVASKFAVRGFSGSLRAELQDDNIGVTSVHPGTIQTNIVRDARLKKQEDESIRSKTQSTFDRLGTPPTAVADKIVRAIKKNSPRVLVTAETYLADTCKRLAPMATDKLVRRLANRVAE